MTLGTSVTSRGGHGRRGLSQEGFAVTKLLETFNCIRFVLCVCSGTKLYWYRGAFNYSNNSVLRSLCQALGQYTRAKKSSEQ